jgi:hypothetical protein
MAAEVELRGHGQLLLPGVTAQGHVGGIVIVLAHPSGCVVLHFGERVGLILREPFIAYGSVERLDVSILLRLAWLDVINPDRPLVGPSL